MRGMKRCNSRSLPATISNSVTRQTPTQLTIITERDSMTWKYWETTGCWQDNRHICDGTLGVALELVLERKGRLRRKGVRAAETKDANTAGHEQSPGAWPVAQHTAAEGSGRAWAWREGRELGCKGRLPCAGAVLSSWSPSKDFK